MGFKQQWWGKIMDLNGNYRLVASFDGGSNGNLKCGIPQILAIENDD